MSKKSSWHSRLAAAVIVIVVLLLALGISNYVRPLPILTPVKAVLPAVSLTSQSLAWPGSGEAAVGAAGYGVLATNNPQTAVPTASVAKLITSLAVLQKYPLQPGQQGPTITLTAADVAIYQQYVAEQGSVVLVQAGEQVSEYQALQAMMLPSANNMADSLASWAFGSLASYQTYASQFIGTLGLANTHIGSDASGFLPSTTSTAHDLVLLGMAALKSPVLAQITDQTQAELPVAGTVYNVNDLLGTNGIFGIKTGNSDQAGGVFLFAAHHALDASHIITIVGAVQGVANLQTALGSAVPLLNSVNQNFTLATIVKAGQTVGHYNTPWKTTATAVAKNSLTAVVWNGSTPQPTLTLNSIKAPIPSGTVVGTVQLSSDSTTLVANNSLSNPSFWWRLTRHN